MNPASAVSVSAVFVSVVDSAVYWLTSVFRLPRGGRYASRAFVDTLWVGVGSVELLVFTVLSVGVFS